MFVRQAPGKGGGGAIVRLVSVIAMATLRIRHVAYGWHQSQHSTSTVQRSTTRTSIFHPHTINIPRCCCCCFPRAIFCSVHRSAFPPLLLCPEYFTHLLRLVGCECICLAEGKALLQALFLCLPRAAFPIFPSKMF